MSTLIVFEKLHNTRDLGGMKTADGRRIRPALLYRSGHLADISDADKEKISGLAGTIIDFRTDMEREKQPDQVIPSMSNIALPVMDQLTPGITREKKSDWKLFGKFVLKPDEAKAYMSQMYRSFADDYAVKQYSRFLQILLSSEGGVLWHCTAGKDRAGIAAVIIEEILGVDREEIIRDYLKTNEYLVRDEKSLMTFARKTLGVMSFLADEALSYLFGAEKEYIDSFYQAVEEKYGSFQTYLEDGLDISAAAVDQFRQKYLI